MPLPADAARFDLADPRLAGDPDAYWQELTQGPDLLPAGRRGVALWRHAEVARVLADRDGTRKCPERALASIPRGPFRDHNAATLAFIDPPRHGEVRRRFARAFAPRMLEALAPAVEEASDKLLQEIADGDDLATGYAARLPLRVIATVLGVEADQEDMMGRAAHAVVGALEPGAPASAYAAADRAVIALSDLIGHQLRFPRVGSLFAAIAESAEALEPTLLLNNAIFLLNAGHETTSRLIAGMARALLLDPDLAARIRRDEGLASGLVEELLRLDPPLHFVPRYLMNKYKTVQPGTLAYLLIAAANRDPRVFTDAALLDPARPNAAVHLSFAAGPHLCLGASLARLEGRIAARHLAAAVSRWRLGAGARRTTGRMFQGWTVLPVTARS